MGRILVRLDLLSPLWGILWVPHRQVLHGEITWGITGSTEVIGVGGPRRNTVHPPLCIYHRSELGPFLCDRKSIATYAFLQHSVVEHVESL